MGARRAMHRIKPVLAHLLNVTLCLALLAGVMKLWRADLRVPFTYEGDGLMVLLWAKTVTETGWYLHNDRLGAPAALDFRDFPMADNLHFLLMRLITAVTDDPALAVNLHFLLTFPLTALTTLFVLRRLSFSYPASILGSQLYAFLPYHFFRGHGHLFLASYFLLPLMSLVILRLYQDDLASRSKKRIAVAVVICLLVSAGGIYYAFFSCYLLLIAGIACSLRLRKLLPLGKAAALVGLIGLSVAVNVTPSLLYRAEHGANPEAVERRVEHAEVFGLKVTQLLLPVTGHRFRPLADLKATYNSIPELLVNENDYTSLGLLCSIGFLLSMGRLFTLGVFDSSCERRGLSPPASRRDERGGSQGSLANGLTILNLAAVLLGTMGGFGAFFSFLGGSWLRCYNRISIFIAFFSLVALLAVLESLRQRFNLFRQSRGLAWGGAGLLLALGIWDQTGTGPEFKPAYGRNQKLYETDAAFVRSVEAALPEGASVFQLPYVSFPEHKVEGMGGYELLRGYLHSRSLRWSYGAMKGRDADRWQRAVAAQAPADLVRALALAGFSGICVDRAFCADSGARLEEELERALAVKPLVRPDGRLAFFSLVEYAANLRGRCSEEKCPVVTADSCRGERGSSPGP